MPSPTLRFPVASDKRFKKEERRVDHGPVERWQHAGRVLELTDKAGVLAARVSEESVLDALALHKILDEVQVEAGVRFKNDYLMAALGNPVTGSYSGMPGARDAAHRERERNEAEEAAYVRWRAASKILGLRFEAVVTTTACHDFAPALADLPSLQKGLDLLARHYGLRRRSAVIPLQKAGKV